MTFPMSPKPEAAQGLIKHKISNETEETIGDCGGANHRWPERFYFADFCNELSR